MGIIYSLFSTPSPEVNGVVCVECRERLPANNWQFEDSGKDGWVRVFYKVVNASVNVTSGWKASATAGADSSVTVGFNRTEEKSEVKVIQYIENKMKLDGYTCLQCTSDNCLSKYPGWDRIKKEIDDVMTSNAIYHNCRGQVQPDVLPG